MPRNTIHSCTQCGLQSAQWHGQCPGCEAWNTLVEEPLAPVAGRDARAGGRRGRRGGSSAAVPGPRLAPRPLREVGIAPVKRMSTGIGELDRVLGGGLVPGSLVLLGGSPGIGKSTLTNMALGHLLKAGHRTLYVSGEESAEQVRLRAERLRLDPADPANPALSVPILAETDRVTRASWEAFGESGPVDPTPFVYPITDFYRTDPISRASATMAQCSEIYFARRHQGPPRQRSLMAGVHG